MASLDYSVLFIDKEKLQILGATLLTEEENHYLLRMFDSYLEIPKDLVFKRDQWMRAEKKLEEIRKSLSVREND